MRRIIKEDDRNGLWVLWLYFITFSGISGWMTYQQPDTPNGYLVLNLAVACAVLLIIAIVVCGLPVKNRRQ